MLQNVHRTRSHRRWRFGAWTVPLALLALAGLPPSAAGEEQGPVVVSPAQAVAIERHALSLVLADIRLAADPGLTLRLERIGQRIAMVSDQPEHLYKFRVLQGEMPQAYSFPGGTICVYERLMQLFPEDDELAFVVGHELAHAVLRHRIVDLRWEVRIDARRQAQEQAPGQKKRHEEELARELLEATFQEFGREHEIEADRYGALYAMRAGYKFSAAERALTRLSETMQDIGDASHPTFAARAQDLAAFRREIALALAVFDEGVVALKAGRAEDAIDRFDIYLHDFPRSVSGWVNLGSAYLTNVRRVTGTPQGLAESLPILPEQEFVLRGSYDAVDLARAERSFEQALRIQPEEVNANAGLALVLMRRSELDRARRLLEDTIAVAPRQHRPELLLLLGNAGFLDSSFDEAAALHRTALAERRDWPDATANLAMTCDRLGDTAGAHAHWERLVDDRRWGAAARRYLALTAPRPH